MGQPELCGELLKSKLKAFEIIWAQAGLLKASGHPGGSQRDWRRAWEHCHNHQNDAHQCIRSNTCQVKGNPEKLNDHLDEICNRKYACLPKELNFETTTVQEHCL